MASMELLQPSSLRIHASWDGDISRAANICVTVEVETKPNSRLLLLNGVKNTGLSHSMVWRISSLGQDVPTVDVTDSKSILAHQVDYIPPSPPRKLFASSRGYRDEYGIAEKPDSFFHGWLSMHDAKETLGDQASAGTEPKQELVEETAINTTDTEESSDDQASTVSGPAQEATEESINTEDTEESSYVLCLDEASEHSLTLQNLDRWTDMDRSIDQYFDDSFLDLPPSPTPSSQDLIPWTSTKEIMNRLKAEQERDPLRVSSEVIVAPPPRDPGVVHQNGQMFLDFPGSVEAKIYRVDIHCLKNVRERQDKWLELDLSQIGAACPEVQGLFVFETPWECEFSTLDLGDAQAANGRLEYQFSPQGLETMAFRQREDRACTRIFSNDDTHTSIESEQEETRQDIQSRQQQISDEPLQSIDETEFIKPKMPSFQSGRPRRTTWRISREFLHQFLGYFFIMMVVVFSAMGGPPKAISTPANTLSTLREVASGMRRHGSSMQTMIMDTVRDVQLRHGWHVYQIFWMDALTNEETDVWIQESATCPPVDILIQESVPVCLPTENNDVPMEESVTAGDFDVLTQELATDSSSIGDADMPKGLAAVDVLPGGIITSTKESSTVSSSTRAVDMLKDLATTDVLPGWFTALMKELATVVSSTGIVDMRKQDSVTADILTEGTSASTKESATAGAPTDNIHMLIQQLVTAGPPTEDIDKHEALATSTMVFSTGNGSIATEEADDSYLDAWSSIGRSILSRIGCSTSAHCIMAAAAEDDDPQWEVFERYRCDAKNSWLTGGFKDRIDDFLGWKPCELQNLEFP